jgi:membrane protein YqaA with SNARE-associated domain
MTVSNPLRSGRFIRQTALSIGAVVGLVYLAAKYLKEPLTAFSQHFVEATGVYGIGLGWMVLDTLPIPFPHDILLGFGELGGLEPIPMVIAASTGSLVGGTMAWNLGRRLRHTPIFRRIVSGAGAPAYDLVSRYGVAALVVGALSPLPYSVACWAAGSIEMRYRTFLLVSLLRIPRITFYWWLIAAGLLNFG